jgi:hypothetical protein
MGYPVPLLARYVKDLTNSFSEFCLVITPPSCFEETARINARETCKVFVSVTKIQRVGVFSRRHAMHRSRSEWTCRILLWRFPRSSDTPDVLMGQPAIPSTRRSPNLYRLSSAFSTLAPSPTLRLRRLPGILHPRQLSDKHETTPKRAGWQRF